MARSSRDFTTLYIVLAVLYYGVLTVASHIPGSTLALVAPAIWDKALHFCAYLILGAFISLGFPPGANNERRGTIFAIATLIVLVLGGIDEYHQSFIPGRQMSAADGLADVAGGAFGAFLVLFLQSPVLAYLRRITPRGS